MPAISIHETSVAENPDIAAFYKRCGYSAGLSADDIILIAALGGHFVGAVRLCSEHQTTVLRGMQVLPEHQRQGIGRALLDSCLSRVSNANCYCISWSHLEQFYRSGGFERCDSSGVPDFLAVRLNYYVKQERDVILMRRLASE